MLPSAFFFKSFPVPQAKLFRFIFLKQAFGKKAISAIGMEATSPEMGLFLRRPGEFCDHTGIFDIALAYDAVFVLLQVKRALDQRLHRFVCHFPRRRVPEAFFNPKRAASPFTCFYGVRSYVHRRRYT